VGGGTDVDEGLKVTGDCATIAAVKTAQTKATITGRDMAYMKSDSLTSRKSLVERNFRG